MINYRVTVVCNNELKFIDHFCSKRKAEECFLNMCKEWYKEEGIEDIKSSQSIKDFEEYYASDVYFDVEDNAHVTLHELSKRESEELLEKATRKSYVGMVRLNSSGEISVLDIIVGDDKDDVKNTVQDLCKQHFENHLKELKKNKSVTNLEFNKELCFCTYKYNGMFCCDGITTNIKRIEK